MIIIAITIAITTIKSIITHALINFRCKRMCYDINTIALVILMKIIKRINIRVVMIITKIIVIINYYEILCKNMSYVQVFRKSKIQEISN